MLCSFERIRRTNRGLERGKSEQPWRTDEDNSTLGCCTRGSLGVPAVERAFGGTGVSHPGECGVQ